MQSATNQGMEKFGGIDIVIANAGIATVGCVRALDPAAFRTLIDAKAGVEHFANALRLEVAHHGVDVGSAHMSWIDTSLVQEGKADSAAFKDIIDSSAWPVNKTTSVEKCGEAFVKGIEGRKRRIDCPGWVGAFRWLRPLFTTSIGEKQLLNGLPKRLALMDAEVAALGRSMSARTEALEKQ